MKYVQLYPAAFVAKISSGVGDCLEKTVTTAHADRDAHRHTHTNTRCSEAEKITVHRGSDL